MAHGYAATGSKLTDISDQPQIANPSGGAYSTTGDLLRFATAVLDDKLLTPAMTATILTPRVSSPQPGGPAVDEYTYGFAYQQINGVTFVGHNGGTPGYEGHRHLPADRLRRRRPHERRQHDDPGHPADGGDPHLRMTAQK